VTLGERGLLYDDGYGAKKRILPLLLPVPPEKVIDTNGAGDIFHGAYMYSYLATPEKSMGTSFSSLRVLRLPMLFSIFRQ
jgi:sugar/nucleoside kinase (ribokinase family)